MRNFIVNTITIIVSVAIAVIALEFSLRAAIAIRSPAVISDTEISSSLSPGEPASLRDLIRPSSNSQMIYQLRPELDVNFIRVRVQTNQAGWREEDIRQAKPSNTIRIIGIGDSVMFGWGVAVEHRYMDLLEGILNHQHSDVRWETLVLAAPGYNLAMQLEALRVYGLPYEPDLIVYGFVANDLCLPNFIGRERSLFRGSSVLVDLLTGDKLADSSLIGRSEAVPDHAGRVGFSYQYCDPDSVPVSYSQMVGMEAFRMGLQDLADIGTQNGIPVVVVSHPLLEQFQLPPLPRDLTLVDGLFENGRTVGPLTPDHLRLGPRDPHPNVRGHALIGQNIFNQLQTSGMWDIIRKDIIRKDSIRKDSMDAWDAESR